MQIITQNLKKGIIKLKITTPEDLWHLTSIIDKDDLTTAKTQRKIKLDKTNKVIKKSVLIKIQTEKTELKDNILRISGKTIESSNEEIPKGWTTIRKAPRSGSDGSWRKTKPRARG